MQKTKILDRINIKSGAAGAEAATQVTRVVDVLAAKSGSVYLLVHEVSDDSRIAISFQHGPDSENWTDGSDDLFDSGAGGEISPGLHATSTPVSLVGVDQLNIIPKIQEISATNPVSATISVWLVLVPF
jgi:hypothetical protein